MGKSPAPGSLHKLGKEEFDFVQRKLLELIAEVVLDADSIGVFEEVRDGDPGIEVFRPEQPEQHRVARVHHLAQRRGGCSSWWPVLCEDGQRRGLSMGAEYGYKEGDGSGSGIGMMAFAEKEGRKGRAQQ